MLCFFATKIIIFKTLVPLSLKTLFSQGSMCFCLVPDSQALRWTWISREEMAQSISPSAAEAAGFSRPPLHFPSLPTNAGLGLCPTAGSNDVTHSNFLPACSSWLTAPSSLRGTTWSQLLL